MKSSFKAALTALASLIIIGFVSSCSKEPADTFTGNYTFKTSGTISITRNTDTLLINMPNQFGQLDIVKTGDGNKCVATMNITGGEMIVFDAVASEDEIVLLPAKWSYSNDLYTGDIYLSGKGVKYGNTLQLTLDCSGELQYLNLITYYIYDDNINCIAKVNE